MTTSTVTKPSLVRLHDDDLNQEIIERSNMLARFTCNTDMGGQKANTVDALSMISIPLAEPLVRFLPSPLGLRTSFLARGSFQPQFKPSLSEVTVELKVFLEKKSHRMSETQFLMAMQLHERTADRKRHMQRQNRGRGCIRHLPATHSNQTCRRRFKLLCDTSRSIGYRARIALHLSSLYSSTYDPIAPRLYLD